MSGESNHIDELIRQKFEGFEPAPPPSAWKKIRKQLDSGASPGNSGPVVFTILTITSLIITLFFIFTNLKDIPVGDPLPDEFTSENYSWSEPYIDNYEGPVKSYSNSLHTSDGNAFYDFRNYVAPDENETAPVEQKQNNISTITVGKKKRIEKTGSFSRFTADPEKKSERSSLGDPSMIRSNILKTNSVSGLQLKSGEIPASINFDYRRENNHSLKIAFEFLPEVSNYSNENPNLTGQGYHLSLTYGISNLYLKTGIGLRNIKEQGNYTIHYNKYLGNYEHVYNVTFDSTDNGVTPTYHTFTVDVYDSIEHVRIGEEKIKNRYLDIPLLFGYEKDFGRLSLHIHAGPNISVLLGRNATTINYPEEQIRIVKAQQELVSRKKINWQVMAGAGIDYRLTNRLDLTIEPVFRYYLSPEFRQNNSNGSGFGFGLRTGISYTISK